MPYHRNHAAQGTNPLALLPGRRPTKIVSTSQKTHIEYVFIVF